MKEVIVMSGYMKATKYAITLHRIISKTIKEYGIGERLSSKEKSEKISKFNAFLRKKFEELGIEKYYAIVVTIKIKGDENDFTLEPYKIFILKPFAVIEGEEFKELSDEEFEKLYEETVEVVMMQETLQEAVKRAEENKLKKLKIEKSKTVSLISFLT